MRLALMLVLLLSSYADACGRCGLFGRRCRFVAPVVVKPHYKQYVQPQPQVSQTINIANVYPSGNTAYTVRTASQLYSYNPDLAIATAGRVADNAVASLTAAVQSGQVAAQSLAEVAKLQAAADHMRAAMSSGSQGGSMTLKITQSGGGIRVEQVKDDQPQPQQPATKPTKLLESKCGKCHGTGLQQPKAGLFLGAGVELQSKQAMRVLDVLRGNSVPEAMQGVVSGLSAEEKAGLADEVFTIWKKD